MHAGRVGASLLQQAGLPEYIATDEQDYVTLARNLAHDHDHRGELRQNLRSQLQASALMDKQRFAAQMEQAYRNMWAQWCEQY